MWILYAAQITLVSITVSTYEHSFSLAFNSPFLCLNHICLTYMDWKDHFDHGCIIMVVHL